MNDDSQNQPNQPNQPNQQSSQTDAQLGGLSQPPPPPADSQTSLPPQPSSSQPVATTPSDDKRDPLQVLEELLAERQQSVQGGDTGSSNSPNLPTGSTPLAPPTPLPGEPPAPNIPPPIDETTKAQMEADLLLAEQAQEEKDEQEIEVQKQALENIKQTPEYQARVQQEQSDEEQSKQEQSAQDGFEIVQLSHKKT